MRFFKKLRDEEEFPYDHQDLERIQFTPMTQQISNQDKLIVYK